VALAALLVGLVAAPAFGAPSQNAIEKQLRCVTCGTSLDVSDAPSAVEMKERIAREIGAGRTEDQILDGFVRDYGRTVLSSPPKSGMDLWLAWALPIGIPLIGLLLLPLIIRGWRRSRSTPADDGPVLDPSDDALVRRELEAFDER
jgi:cytochrome c-type biogenesis protein CcmH